MRRPDLQPTESARFQGAKRRFRRTLTAGFAVVLLIMIASAAAGLWELRRLGDRTERMTERYLMQVRLAEELERQQGGIGILLYNISETDGGHREVHRREAGLRRQAVLSLVSEAERSRLPEAEKNAWTATGAAAEMLFDELDRLLRNGGTNSTTLSSNLSTFMEETTRVMDLSYSGITRDRAAEIDQDAGEIDESTTLVLVSISLAILCAVACAAAAITVFRGVEKQAETLAKLAVHTFAEQEEAARRFSQEMHDEFGQTLNAIESTLTSVEPQDEVQRERLRDAIALSKEAQGMARDMSRLLRPRILDDFGLDPGLRELAQGFSRRTGITVDYRSNFQARLDPAVETHLFRIAQEALTNSARHSMASNIEMSLDTGKGKLQMRVADNGGGLKHEGSRNGLGLLGMRERIRAAGGRLDIISRPNQGVEILAEVALPGPQAPGVSGLETVRETR